MKIAPRQADSFLRQPSAQVRAILAFGPDSGLVHERIAALAATVLDEPDDPFRYTELQANAVRSDPALLVDEALARAFGGGRRVVVVNDAGDGLTDMFRTLLDHPGLADADAGFVLARGGDLAGRSSLRRLFENADNAAALACYADDVEGLHRLVGDTLRAHRIEAEPGAIDLIVDRLGNDRQLNRRELEKLALYAGDGSVVGATDIMACLGDSGEASLDDAILAAAEGDYRGLEKALQRVWSEGASPVAVLRAGQRHFQRLHLVSVQVDQARRPVEEAMKTLRPPVFWKVSGRFRTQVGRWRPRSLEQALERLTEAESLVKTTGIPDRAACARALLAISQLARTGQRR